MNLIYAHSRVCLLVLEQQTAKMAEGPDPGPILVKSPTTPTLKELSNALDSVVDWFTLGVKLELEDHELRTIEQNYRGDRCKLDMLSRWLRSGKPPTWKALADALRLMGEHAVASKIQAKYCSPSSATTDTADTRTPPAKSPPNPSAVAVAQRNIQMIKGKFSLLVTKSRRKLQYRKIDVDDIQTFLVTMYSSPDSEDGSDTVTTVVESAKSLDEIFRALSKYRLWDYINYYLLQNIIEAFADDDSELNGMMEQYQEALTGHILTLRIQTYLDATHPIATSVSDNEVIPLQQDYKLFEKLTAKCEVNVTNHTLSYVIDLWRSLAKQFALPRPAMILHDIAEGCIAITWLIPANLVKHVTRMARETANMFAEENVLRVTLEEQCIYPLETELEVEPSLLETQTVALKRKIIGNTSQNQDLPGEGSMDFPEEGSSDLSAPGEREDIPEFELKIRDWRVISINYTFLWQHMEPSRLLPILVDKLLMTETKKKEAESYTQKFAQNSVIIYQLFASGYPPLKLCDTLDITGQEHIARKLLQDYKHPASGSVHLPSADTAVHSDLSETSELFQQLQQKVMDLLDQLPNALAKLKQVLASLVLPLGEGKVAPLVDPLAYENTQTVRELFRLMAPYWNPLSTDLLGLLLEASGCNQAASKVAEFVEVRASKGHLVLCIRQLPTLASGENDLDVADLETVHSAPLSELQSLHPAVFARLPEHKATSTRTTVRISVEVNKPLVCIADYEKITIALSCLFQIPRAALVYAGCSKAPLVLCWLVSHELVAYIYKQGESSGERLLAESKVTGVAVGDQIHKCPTVMEVELWEACWDGQMEQIRHHLMASVNVNILTLFGESSPLRIASGNGYDGIVEMLLQAGATVDLQNKDGWTALKHASNNGHHKVVEILLAAGANPDLQDKNGDTPLTLASYKGHPSVVRVLLQGGATINTTNQDGCSPLYFAGQEGYDVIVEMLLQAGATVDLQNKNYETALNLASYIGHHKVVELLLAAGASSDLQDKDGRSPLHDASQEGHDGIVEMLLQAGATVDLQDKDGVTPLYIACQKGHLPVVERLITAKADFNHQTKTAVTPLYIACHEGHLPVVERLITAKADVNHHRKDGATPLYIACQNGHLPVVECLIAAKADINHQTKNGDTPLIVASYNGHPSVVKVLLQAGATINTANQWGGTALRAAIEKEHEDIVELLLEANADPDLPDKDGWTALKHASNNGHHKVVEILLAAGANPDLQDKEGFLPLHNASAKGYDEIVEMLLQAGATVDLQTKNGDTPLIIASYKGHSSVVRVLLQSGATINTANQWGGTALRAAIEIEHEDIVELLLEANADPDLPDKDSQKTPLMTAAKKGNVGIVKKLIKRGANVNLTNEAGNTAYDLASVEGHTDVCQELLAHHSS